MQFLTSVLHSVLASPFLFILSLFGALLLYVHLIPAPNLKLNNI
jgi:hypothetical protein